MTAFIDKVTAMIAADYAVITDVWFWLIFAAVASTMFLGVVIAKKY
jgi:hypothetical protein